MNSTRLCRLLFIAAKKHITFSSINWTVNNYQDNDEDNSSEVNRKDDWVEFIREFQDFMNEAIEWLLNKPARRHPRQKDKPEPCTEQGKRKEALRQEAN